jgi:hypothetical protein
VVGLLKSLSFQQANSWPFGGWLSSPAHTVAPCVTSRAVPVEFRNCNDSVTRVIRNLRVPPQHSRDILQLAKGIILVKSTQIWWFSKWSGRGGWSGRAIAQRRPRVSKLGLKGLSDYHSNETALEAARQGASEPNKGLLSWHVSQKGELKSSSWLNKKKAKGNLPEKKHQW